MTPPHLCAAALPGILPPLTSPVLFGRQAQDGILCLTLPDCLSLPPCSSTSRGQAVFTVNSPQEPVWPSPTRFDLLMFRAPSSLCPEMLWKLCLAPSVCLLSQPILSFIEWGGSEGAENNRTNERKQVASQTNRAWEFITAEEKADRRKLLLKTTKSYC